MEHAEVERDRASDAPSSVDRRTTKAGRDAIEYKRRALSSICENLPRPDAHAADEIHRSLLCATVHHEQFVDQKFRPTGSGVRQDSGYASSRMDSALYDEDEDGACSQSTPISRHQSDCSNLSSRKMLKGFPMHSNSTVSFRKDGTHPVRHFDSFDSVIDTSERQESITSVASYGEKSSGIDLTCSSASPAKQQVAQCNYQVFLENYNFHKKRETDYRALYNYMDKQRHLDKSMRSVLVDWLVDVSLEFRFSEETLHVAVYLVDQFLSMMSVTKDKLQLVGTVAMLIAAKYQEIYPPKVNEFVSITDDAYTRCQLLKTERIMLAAVNFAIHPPTINEFIAAYTYASKASKRSQCLAQFFGDLALQDYEFISHLPSKIGAAATWLALGVCESDWHNVLLCAFSGYDVVDLRPVIFALWHAWRQSTGNQLKAIRQKFAMEKWHNVSLIAAPRTLPI